MTGTIVLLIGGQHRAFVDVLLRVAELRIRRALAVPAQERPPLQQTLRARIARHARRVRGGPTSASS